MTLNEAIARESIRQTITQLYNRRRQSRRCAVQRAVGERCVIRVRVSAPAGLQVQLNRRDPHQVRRLDAALESIVLP